TWDFGDGTTGSGAVVDHVFPSQQQHRVVLTVTDNKGARASSAVICDSTITDPNTGDGKQ
ncbi:MAG: PKD domain-containing protein, partial [Anaerolineae bacterium]|nr:PKD domain-containing protein [Anaerolineae bacterium]